MRFVVDNQLPIALAVHLQSRGHDCTHVLDVGLSDADDRTVWDYAIRELRIVISKDQDFIFLANRPGDIGKLLWLRLGNCRNAALMRAIDQVHDSLIIAFDSGQRIVELQ